MDNLWKWRVIVVAKCCMCKRNEESVDHLLHCEVACAIWNVFFSQFKLSWVMNRQVVDLNACWWIVDNTRSAAVWKMVPSYLFWCLWREMNDRNFEDHDRTWGGD
jgi:hypothetical protein